MIQDKLTLLMEACKVATEIESRGGIMAEHQPKIKLVYESGEEWQTTTIVLCFPDGKEAEACNWGGMHHTVEKAIDTNLLCLRYELQDRQRKIAEMLSKLDPVVDAAFPPAEKVSETVDFEKPWVRGNG